jgi:hypothetical protein
VEARHQQIAEEVKRGRGQDLIDHHFGSDLGAPTDIGWRSLDVVQPNKHRAGGSGKNFGAKKDNGPQAPSG